MIKITGLDERPDKIDPSSPEVLMTFRRFYGMVVGNSIGKSGVESLDVVSITSKLNNEGDSVELEDAEFRILFAKVSENQIKLPSQIHGQMYGRLLANEKAAEAAKRQPKK